MKPTRRSFLAGLAGAGLRLQGASKPNILFIITDDQRWDALGCAGHPVLKTPHLDRIAREGAYFENAFVTTPLCSPSRASFLTGQYAHTHGVRGNGPMYNQLSHKLVTWPRLLKEAGYETAYIGKWHMGNDDQPRPGFDHWVSFRGQGTYEDPVLNINGERVKVQGYMTDILTGHAVEFLKRPRSRPFVLYLAHKAVHGPFTPAPRHKGLYSTEPLPRRPNVDALPEGKPVLRRREVTGDKSLNMGQAQRDELIRNQLRGLMAVDEGVGEMLETLESTGQLDNTLVVFTSDNGYFWGEHGLGDKRFAYEESIRIPLLMRYPQLIRPGTRISELVLNVDIAPTMLELAGLRTPAGLHGMSLLGLLRGRTRRWRESFLAEYFLEPNFPRTPSWQAVRTRRWKYIHYTELEGMDELYDLEADPYEMKNLIDEPAARKVLVELRRQLEHLLKTTS